VSISQPHVRPIVRGKAGKRVEFGAKVSISHQCNGYVSVDTLSWHAYNEGADLPGQIETYKKRLAITPRVCMLTAYTARVKTVDTAKSWAFV
jgi:hypothetical protein